MYLNKVQIPYGPNFIVAFYNSDFEAILFQSLYSRRKIFSTAVKLKLRSRASPVRHLGASWLSLPFPAHDARACTRLRSECGGCSDPRLDGRTDRFHARDARF